MALSSDGKIVDKGFERVAGLNSIRLTRIISGIPVSTTDENLKAINVTHFPNPLSEQCILDYELDQNETLSVNLYDLQGALIQPLLPLSERNAGQHKEKLKLANSLPPGSYFVNLETKNRSQAVKVVME